MFLCCRNGSGRKGLYGINSVLFALLMSEVITTWSSLTYSISRFLHNLGAEVEEPTWEGHRFPPKWRSYARFTIVVPRYRTCDRSEATGALPDAEGHGGP